MTSTQEQAQEAAAQAKDKAGEVAGQAAQQAKGRVRSQVDERSTLAGQQVSSTASDARDVAQALREKGQEKPAQLAEQAADRVDQLGSYLQEADADRIIHDIEDLGRKQPMAVVFGGLALGFAASRFLKASAEQRYEAASTGNYSRQSGYSAGYQPGYQSGYSTRPTTPALPATTGTPPVPGATPAPAVGGVTPAFPDPIVGGAGVSPERPTGNPSGGF